MVRRSTRVVAIVLGRTKLKEQDLILTMIGEDGAQLKAVAKGGRKPGSRLAARTELFCESDFLLSQGRGLPIITEAEVRDRHANLLGDPDRVAAASVLCEVARLTSYEDVADPFLFHILSRALDAVSEARTSYNEALVVAAFALKVLSHCGWRPELDACVACGDPSLTWFSVAMGGVLCESCAKDVAGAIRVTSDHVLWISALVTARFDVLLACDVDEHTSMFLLRLAHEWCTTHLDARLRAFEFYAGL